MSFCHYWSLVKKTDYFCSYYFLNPSNFHVTMTCKIFLKKDDVRHCDLKMCQLHFVYYQLGRVKETNRLICTPSVFVVMTAQYFECIHTVHVQRLLSAFQSNLLPVSIRCASFHNRIVRFFCITCKIVAVGSIRKNRNKCCTSRTVFTLAVNRKWLFPQ